MTLDQATQHALSEVGGASLSNTQIETVRAALGALRKEATWIEGRLAA